MERQNYNIDTSFEKLEKRALKWKKVMGNINKPIVEDCDSVFTFF